MKSYTDLEQSKKLAEILPIDSADMWWSKNFIYYNPTAAIGISAEYSNVYTYKFGEDDIPCWSLAALLDYLSSNFYIDIKYLDTNWELDCRVQVNYERELIDACVEMIFGLKRRIGDNLL